MAQQIRLKRSAVTGKTPLTTDVALGELAINTFDGKMFFKRNNGTESIIELSNVGHTHALGTLTGVVLTSPSTNQVLQFNGTNWVNATIAGSGTVTSVALSGGTTGLTVTGSPITTSGTLTLGGTLNNSATTATSANTASAIVARDASGDFSAGTISATTLNSTNLNVDSNTLFVDATNDRVGIGTGTPSTRLHVSNANNDANNANSLALQLDAPWMIMGDRGPGRTFTNGVGIKFHDGGVAHYSIGQIGGNFVIANTGSNGEALFPSTTSSTGIILTSADNVAIGKTTAATRLDVNGTVTATAFSGSGASLTSIPNSATTATSANTASAIVARDGSGNFSAGTITATLSGNASTATTATTANALNTANNYQVNQLTNSTWYNYFDGSRNPSDSTYYPNSSTRAVRYFFANASLTGTGGNYSGVMQFNPWDGTTASTGDASYQLAFGSTATNGGGIPQLNIRKGIDTTWNSWHTLLHSGNFNNYSPTLTGTGASGTWGINITGTAPTLQTARTLTIAGTGKSFNGSADVSWTANELAAHVFNNTGEGHGSRSSFDATTPSYGFGWRFVGGSTNGPGTGGSQFYSLYTGLGTEYPATGAGSYGMQLAIDRNSATPYLSVRFNESNSLGTWRKIQAGNADTATTLQTARTINGTSFNGSANITTNSWGTSRTLSFTGDVTGSSAVDGSANVATAMTLANSGVTAGTHTKVTVDAKGRVTAGTTLAATDIPNLDASKITSGVFDQARLPSYVDDVLEYTNLASFPVTGETGKIYVDLTTNKTYRWSGSTYIYITSGAVDSVAGKTGVVTLVKADVGLSNVDNTADASKNVATAATWTTARTISLGGDLSGSASVNGSADVTITASIGANTVTDADLRDSAALSVIGRSANSSGDPADIAAGTDGHVLRRSGTTLDFGTVATAGIANGAITPEKLSGAQTGSAPIYGARAWVNFNGTGTPAIRASGNVSSITDLGDTGQYRVNFTTAFSDTDYVMTGVANNFNYGQSLNVGLSYGASSQGSFNAGGTTRRNKTTALCDIIFGIGNSTARYDPYEAMLTFYR